MGRDDFSSETKRRLEKRAGGHCSICGAQTGGPTENPEGGMSIGVAAHITAASPGGPRFDQTLSAKDRRSIRNGIWACQNCAHRIDVDRDAFTVEELRSRKAQAEVSARTALGAPRRLARVESVAGQGSSLVRDLESKRDALRGVVGVTLDQAHALLTRACSEPRPGELGEEAARIHRELDRVAAYFLASDRAVHDALKELGQFVGVWCNPAFPIRIEEFTRYFAYADRIRRGLVEIEAQLLQACTAVSLQIPGEANGERTVVNADEAQFREELRGFVQGSPNVWRICSRGHWWFAIRPGGYRTGRIADVLRLAPVLKSLAVSGRGLSLPRVSHPEAAPAGLNYTEEHHDRLPFLESWRFTASGQLLHYSALPEDWEEPPGDWPIEGGWAVGKVLSIGATIHRFTEIFELAARMAQMDEVGDSLEVDMRICGLKGRRLWTAGLPHTPMLDEYAARIEEFPRRWFMPRPSYVENPRSLALDAVLAFFKFFGFDAAREELQRWQAETPPRTTHTRVG